MEHRSDRQKMRLLTILLLCGLGLFSPEAVEAEGRDAVECRVMKVITADTLAVRFYGSQAANVRLIGVGLSRPSGTEGPLPLEKEAFAFVTQQLSGQTVKIELASERRDSSYYPFVYLFLPDGVLLNAELIKRGYALADDEIPFSRLGEFKEYEREAREGWKGMWKQQVPERTDPQKDIFLNQD